MDVVEEIMDDVEEASDEEGDVIVMRMTTKL
jgi:hypothetical protein